MKYKKYLKKFNTVCISKNLRCAQKIMNLFINNKIECINKSWGNTVKNDVLNLLDKNIWCTYDKCANIKFFLLNNDDINVIVYIYNGDILNGQPIDIKWSATFKIDESTQ